MTDEVKLKGKKDILNFGKYKGQTVEWVLELHPSYLVWAHDTISWFKVKPVIYNKACELAIEESFKRNVRRHLRYMTQESNPYWSEAFQDNDY